MKRCFSVTLSVALVMVCMAGCTNLKMEYGIDEDGYALSAWSAEVNAADLSKDDSALALDFVNHMKSSFNDAGYISPSLTEENEKYLLSASKNSSFVSREDAFNELISWMKDDEKSPFTKVSSNDIIGPSSEEYFIEATMDISALAGDLSAVSDDEGFNLLEQPRIDTFLQQSQVTLVLRLPGQAVEAAGDTTYASGMTTCSVTSSIQAPITIMLHTRWENEQVKETIAHQQSLNYWALPVSLAASGMVILCVVLLVYIRKSKKRASDFD